MDSSTYVEIDEGEPDECPICAHPLAIGDLWRCETCENECHQFCIERQVFHNQPKCPFCNGGVSSSSSVPATLIVTSLRLSNTMKNLSLMVLGGVLTRILLGYR